jgi:hypothetical protein
MRVSLNDTIKSMPETVDSVDIILKNVLIMNY